MQSHLLILTLRETFETKIIEKDTVKFAPETQQGPCWNPYGK